MTDSENPPSALEHRVVDSLVAAGVIRRRRGRLPLVARVAAVAAFVAIGIGIGRALPTRMTSPPLAEPRFALLLYRSPLQDSETPSQVAADVAEHHAWARRLAEQGHQISGEKLDLATTILNGPAIGQTETLEGFFVISAASAREAAELARSCPHAVHGGIIVVRPISPT